MKKLLHFLKKTLFFQIIKYSYIFTFAVVSIYIGAASIIYLRAAEQQCYPDGTYLEFINFTHTLQTLLVAPWILYLLWLVTDVIEIVANRVKQIKIPERINPNFNLKINLPKSNKFLRKVGHFVLRLISILYMLTILTMLILGLYLLFFDDPCQFIN